VDPSDKLFHGIPTSFKACHYHSWAVKANHIPNELRVTATNKDGLVMAIAHKQFDVRGVQFHPESIMTEHGQLMIKNWLTL
jgi:anthranilate synthase component 2